jgi:DNA-binding transcriptional ArsR family regulator
MTASSTIDPVALEQAAERATLFLRSVANRDRLLLLCQLVDGERSVGELEAATGVRQPTLSQQLAVLREEGLVATRRDGKFIHYRLASVEVVQLLQLLQALFCSPDPTTAPRRKRVSP